MLLNVPYNKLVVIFDDIVQNFKIIFSILVLQHLMRNFYKNLKKLKGKEG